MDAHTYLLEEISLTYSSLMDSKHFHIWFLAVLSSCLIGVSSMFPLFLISFANDNCLINSDSSPKTLLKYFLSFAVGALLGDVFLHLLPEASKQIIKSGVSADSVQIYIGLWILSGIFTFGFIETVFSHFNAKKEDAGSDDDCADCDINSSADRNTKTDSHLNGHTIHDQKANGGSNIKIATKEPTISIIGYLNLLANGIDNLTHGLAIGASFLVSIRMGLLTTFAIIIHEIPHEIADFAILIRSGFLKWDAVRAQVSIAGLTLLGTIITLLADSVEVIGTRIAWILAFTSGGFLHIALVSILPELLSEKNLQLSLRQACCIAAGITVMAFVNLIPE